MKYTTQSPEELSYAACMYRYNVRLIWEYDLAENATVGVNLQLSLQVSKAGVSRLGTGCVPNR